MIWMLRLYPRAWRRRYGEEVAALVTSEPRSFRLFLDLLAGAIDARVNPQWTPATSPSGGQETMSSILRLCSTPPFSREDQRRSVAWMIGGSLGFAGIATVIQLAFGQTILSQTVLYSSYPMALILSGQYTYLKPYSRTVRWSLMAAMLAAMFLFFLGVTYLASRL